MEANHMVPGKPRENEYKNENPEEMTSSSALSTLHIVEPAGFLGVHHTGLVDSVNMQGVEQEQGQCVRHGSSETGGDIINKRGSIEDNEQVQVQQRKSDEKPSKSCDVMMHEVKAGSSDEEECGFNGNGVKLKTGDIPEPVLSNASNCEVTPMDNKSHPHEHHTHENKSSRLIIYRAMQVFARVKNRCDFVTMEPLGKLPHDRLFKLIEPNGAVFLFDVRSLAHSATFTTTTVTTSDDDRIYFTTNPYTRRELSSIELRRLKKKVLALQEQEQVQEHEQEHEHEHDQEHARQETAINNNSSHSIIVVHPGLAEEQHRNRELADMAETGFHRTVGSILDLAEASASANNVETQIIHAARIEWTNQILTYISVCENATAALCKFASEREARRVWSCCRARLVQVECNDTFWSMGIDIAIGGLTIVGYHLHEFVSAEYTLCECCGALSLKESLCNNEACQKAEEILGEPLC